MAATMGSMRRNLKDFSTLLEKPEVFLSTQPSLCKKLRTATKAVYDFAKTQESGFPSGEGALPRLIVKDFDEEQIWQEIELQNTHSVKKLLFAVSGVLTKKNISFKGGAKPSPKKWKKGEGEEGEKVVLAEEDEDEASSDEDAEDEELRRIKTRLEGGEDSDDFDVGSSDLEMGEDEIMEEEEEEEEEDDIEEDNTQKKRKKLKYKSVVDDKFFKLSEMEAFLVQEDAREEKRRRLESGGDDGDESDDEEDDGDDIDMFAEIPTSEEEDGGGELRYEDFFDPPDEEPEKKEKKKKVKFAHDEKESEEEDDASEEMESDKEEVVDSKVKAVSKTESLSTFEKRQEKLRKRIDQLEKASLSDKTWQLTGEVAGPARPENSLLEEHLQFDVTTRAAPVVTEETTKTIEDIVRQRIKDKAWDDVERKVKPKGDVFEYKKRIVLDQEKSKQSLGDVYEQEFLKQQKEEKEEREEEDPKHENIRKSMRSLFLKLDALSNFHYTPKEARPELKIVSNMPTIAMEEVAPVSVSDQKLLAPEEVKEKAKRDLKGETERTTEDKKRDHREKKERKRVRRKEREQREKLVSKLNPGLGNKYSKEKALRDLEKIGKSDSSVTLMKSDSSKTSLTSSSAFFTKLQDEVSSHVKHRQADKKKSQKKTSSVKLKL
ncbi:U3 small nucleolar ribonucleoprotein protein MPP10-like [Haliotis rufescens]|uniref:U3 small nucleolar ribonucleoprotein protein MPP10-like n=1 Tax=Haliotis rufescens TaxID=6454 RepID=UPI00201F35CC|nr:U3 small nucleolar ribonucleoprotein protein MPP10-like [Haliotis rufescens]